jgi:hypothetical protein
MNKKYLHIIIILISVYYCGKEDPFSIKDVKTSLLWKKCSIGQLSDLNCDGEPNKFTWAEALEKCAKYSSNSQKWRLPTKTELESLRKGDGEEAIDSNLFPNSNYGMFWSSTEGEFENAWAIGYAGKTGYIGQHGKNDSYYVRCVSDL